MIFPPPFGDALQKLSATAIKGNARQANQSSKATSTAVASAQNVGQDANSSTG